MKYIFYHHFIDKETKSLRIYLIASNHIAINGRANMYTQANFFLLLTMVPHSVNQF